MHILVAVPGSCHLDSLSPLFSALGEPVVPVAIDTTVARRASGSAILDGFRSAMEKQKSSALFPTTYTPVWGIFEALLGEAPDRRALVFYEPSCLGVARLLQSGARTHIACDAWLAEARSLERFVRANNQHVTLVPVDKALVAPRSLLGACADRFLFDLADLTVRPAKSSPPPLIYRLVAEFAAQQEPALRTLDAKLEDLAFMPDRGPQTDPGELDKFIAKYHKLEDSHQILERVKAEADALRVANRLAEESAQALRVQLSGLEARFDSKTTRPEATGKTEVQRNSIAVLEAEIEQLRRVLGDVQIIAETHVSEAADLRERLHGNKQGLATLEAELRAEKASLLRKAKAGVAIATKSAPASNPGHESVDENRPSSLMSKLNLRLWWQTRRDIGLVLQSDYFDLTWYIKKNADVQAQGIDPAKHFVRHGGQEGRDPCAAFSSRRYLEDYPDVARAGINPLVHYLRRGKTEGRRIHRADKA